MFSVVILDNAHNKFDEFVFNQLLIKNELINIIITRTKKSVSHC